MLEEIRDDEHMIRAVWPKYIKDDGSISSAAFKPRQKESGVSVERTGDRPVPVAVLETKKLFSPESGLVSVSVLDCKAAKTYLVFDPRDNHPYHSQIYSTPEMTPLDPVQWYDLASRAVVRISPSK